MATNLNDYEYSISVEQKGDPFHIWTKGGIPFHVRTQGGTLFTWGSKGDPFHLRTNRGTLFTWWQNGGPFSSSNLRGDLFHLRTKAGTHFSSGPKGRPFSKYNSMNAWSPSKFTFESCRPLITRESILVPRTHALKTIWEWHVLSYWLFAVKWIGVNWYFLFPILLIVNHQFLDL